MAGEGELAWGGGAGVTGVTAVTGVTGVEVAY